MQKILIIVESALFMICFFDYYFENLIYSDNLFRFLSIGLCIFLTNNIHNRIIFFITSIADFYLLFTNNYILGISIFILAQALRLLYFNKNNSSKIIILISITLVIILSFMINKVIALSIGYTILLMSNTIFAFKYKNIITKLGMVLFILCDICVAINYLTPYKPFLSSLIWIFYIPSALLLAISE